MNINPAVGGRLTKIATGNLGQPRLSDDGRTVVYTRWNGENWDIERVRDGQLEAVSKDPRHDVGAQVSGNGDVVVWSRFEPTARGGQGSWDLIRWENGKETVLASESADETDPQITSDGRTVVYTYDDQDKKIGFDIRRIRDGKNEEITGDWPVDTEPLPADNGERVVFRRKIRFDGGDLWIRDESGAVKPLTYSETAELRPSLSGDGNTLAWTQTDEGDSDIYIYNLSNGHREKIGERKIEERDPELSDDGQVLAYSRSDGEQSNIILRDHGRTVQVTRGGSNAWPALSSDGKVVAWTAVDPDNPSQNAIFKLERS